MHERALQFLACPKCRAELHLSAADPANGQVRDGWLRCTSGCGQYPVVRGVPRLLPELCAQAPADRQPPPGRRDLQERTQSSFGFEWRLYRYGDTTWGVTLDERIQVALYELGWTEQQLAGKSILDAGCGNGTLSAALAERGAEVLAVDLSNSVERAYAHCRTPGVHFVQANLFFPPLRRQRFDAIYSCGVFHHTPDTRRCFTALLPVLKHDPHARYFLWLYAKRSWLFNGTVEPLMKITRRLPGGLLTAICLAAAPAVEGLSRALVRLRAMQDVPRSLTDRAVILYDLLSPQYVHYLDAEDVQAWCAQAGLTRVERKSYRADHGACAPTAAVLDKYRRVCRPGFGILARYPSGGSQ